MELTSQIIMQEHQHASHAVMGAVHQRNLRRPVQRTRTIAAAAPPNPLSLQQLTIPRPYTVYQPSSGPGKLFCQRSI